MLPTLISLLAIVTAIFYWLDSARARELATAIVGELCKRRDYQLLDETVALNRVGIGHTNGGLRIKRLFRFDYSVEGMGRQQGSILLVGTLVSRVDLGEFDAAATLTPDEVTNGDGAQHKAPEDSDGKVIPFRRRH